MAEKSLEQRVSALEVQLGNKTLQEHFREQAELLDQLFAERDETWNVRFGGLERNIGALKADVGTLKADVGTLKAAVGTLKADVETLKVDVGALKKDMVVVREGIGILLRRIG